MSSSVFPIPCLHRFYYYWIDMLVLYLSYKIKLLFCSYGYVYIHMDVVLLETYILVLLIIGQDNYI
jgi:hypothetical protein